MKETAEHTGAQLAEDHVEWFVEILKPLLISFMEHGYKHGLEAEEEKEKNQNE